MLNPESPLPLYQQLKTVLRQAIESGVWEVGQAIPPERELIERYGVSRITVRQALADLVTEGLLYRRHGKGTFVAERTRTPIAETLIELTGHLEELQLRGLHPTVELLGLTRGSLPDQAAEALKRLPGADGWSLYRRVLVNGEPLMLSEVYLPSDLDLEPDAEVIRETGIAPWLSARGYHPVKGVQRIAAQAATPEEARHLGIRKGDPVLRVVRLIMGAGERPLVWFRTFYRADRYEYEVELQRRR